MFFPWLDARIGVKLDNYYTLADRLKMVISPENFFKKERKNERKKERKKEEN